ncbi:MAG: serine hydrolase [Acetivibrionales bacterium]|jgi:beta-lactamase class A
MLFNKSMSRYMKLYDRRKNRKKSLFVLLALVFIVTVVAVFSLTRFFLLDDIINGFNMFSSKPEGVSNRMKEYGTQLLNGNGIAMLKEKERLLQLEYQRKKWNERYSTLKTELEEYLAGYEGQYGVYFIDLINGGKFGINEKDVYIAASTIKIPLNLFLYKQMESGLINPEGTITYMGEDYEEGTGLLQFEEFGNEYSIRELSRLSIVVSDNVATNMLLRVYGRKNIKDYMKSLGGTVISYEENTSCPYDMALYMKEVYEFFEEGSELSRELMYYFENTKHNDRIPKLLPEDTRIAHKVGNWPPVSYHDVGIVFARRPYVISIMSKDTQGGEACSVIANISKKVYDFVKKYDYLIED